MFLLTLINVPDWLEQHQLPCMYKSITGHECPGCGMQRSFIEILRGQIWDSIITYPGLIPLIITILFTFLQLKFKWKWGHKVIIYLVILTISIILISFVVKKFI